MTLQLPGYSEQSANKDWSFSNADGIMRFEVRAGDRWIGDSADPGGKERTEVALTRGIPKGAVQTIEYDFKVENGAVNTSKWTMIGQLHAHEDADDIFAGPLIEIGLKGEKMQINVRADPNASTTSRPAAVTVFTDTADLVRGDWHHLKIEYLLDPGGDGMLRVSRDGTTLVEYHGAIGYNDVDNPYWKMGIYRGAAAETMVMDVKNLDVSLDVTPSDGQQVNGSNNKDHLYGYGGDDYMRGYDGDDELHGGTGNDNINGGSGADYMVGGDGNDTYAVDHIKDVVVEMAGGGVDLINSSINYKLTANFENLTLTGAADLTGDGNELANKIVGNAGANVLTGGAGNDTLDGGAGADTLIGGKGDDTFIVDNVNDKIVELSGGGEDTVKTALHSYALGDHLENLIMTGLGGEAKGNTLANHIVGDKGDNLIDGKTGNDLLEGGWGNDILIGGGGDDILTGNQNGDIFRFGIGSGHDVVTDFGNGYYDSLDFSGWISRGHSPVMTVEGSDVVFSDGVGDTVRLLGVNAHSLVATSTGYTDR